MNSLTLSLYLNHSNINHSYVKIYLLFVGWQLAGLEPFDIRTIFQQGTSWAKINEENAQTIIAAIPELAAEMLVSRKGACSDAEINALLGHIPGVSTDIVGMDDKVLNQQRALWLTADKARNIMIDINLKLQEQKRVKKEKQDAKDLVPLEKRRAAQLVAQVLDGTLQGRQEATSIKVGCNNECGAIRSVVTEGTIVPHDGWLGCQTFPLWFCGK
jgi:hypothetical protein